MGIGIFNRSAIDSLTETVKFAERRHQLLASNIANLDTPGYQTQDLSVENFQAALGEQMAASRAAEQFGPSSPGRVEGIAADQAQKHVREAMEQILYHDGSDVGLEQQVTSLSKNQSMHSTAIALLRHQMQQLQMAISESVNV